MRNFRKSGVTALTAGIALAIGAVPVAFVAPAIVASGEGEVTVAPAAADPPPDLDFDQRFSFIFSARPGTPAANLPDDTPLEVKKERLMRLQEQLNAPVNCFRPGIGFNAVEYGDLNTGSFQRKHGFL